VVLELWQEAFHLDHIGVDDDFHDLGGHSLLAMSLVGRIRERVGVEVALIDILESPTVALLSAWIDELRALADEPAARPTLVASGRRHGRLLAPQRGSYLLDRFAPDNSVNRFHYSLWLDGALDVEALERALDAVRARHEILRTRFFTQDGEPRQEVLDMVPGQVLRRADVSTLPATEQASADATLQEQFVHQAFDLAAGDVMRALLVTWSPTRHRLTVAFHHTVCDPQSLLIFDEELFALWRGVALPPPTAQYLDLVDYLDRIEASPFGADQRAYWRTQLAGAVPIELPADLPRATVDARRAAHGGYVTFPAGSVVDELGPDMVAALEHVVRDSKSSMMSVLMAGFATYVAELTGQDDLTLVSSLLFRHVSGLERSLGFFANPLIVRISTAGAPSFVDVVTRTREAVAKAYEHGETDVLALAPNLFRILFNYQHTADRIARTVPPPPPGVTRSRAPLEGARHQQMEHAYDLILSISAYPDRIAFALRYNRALFHEATAARFLRDYLARVRLVTQSA
jgi:aryl carrier-like protein